MKETANIRFRNLCKVELLGVAEICERIHRVEADDSFVIHIHDVMTKAFGNVHFCAELHQMDPFETLERINYTGDMKWMPFFYEHVNEHPQFHLLLDQKPEVGATHHTPDLKAFRSSALFNEFFAKVQSHNQMWIALFAGNEFLNCIYARETPYSNNELAMMQMIKPHLEIAWSHWKQARSLKMELEWLKHPLIETDENALANQQIRMAIDALPRRQREVIERVAEGYDNQQIAESMGISIRTVHKHLENIFRALDIHHRTKLAAKWHQCRL